MRTTSHRLWIGILVLTTVSLVLSGCALPFGKTAEAPPPPAAATAKPTKPALTPTAPAAATATKAQPTLAPGTFLVWHDLEQDQSTALAKAILPGAALQKYDGEDALEKAAAGGKAPFDIALVNAKAVRFLSGKNLIRPLDDGVLGDDVWRDIAPPGMQGVTSGGHVWAAPYTLGMHLLLFYNPKLVPTPPSDTAGLIAAAAKLSGDDRFGLGMNALEPSWLLPWLSAYGGWPVDGKGNPTLNTEPMTRSLTFVHDLAYVQKVMAPLNDYETGLAAFKAGKTALWIDGEWALDALHEAKDVEWGVARLPVLSDTGVEPACLVAGKYLVVSSAVQGPRLDKARDQLERILSGGAAAPWFAKSAQLPASLEILKSSLIQGDEFRRVSAAQMLAGRAVGLSSGLEQAMESMRGGLEDVMSDRIPPAEAARGMQARADALAH